MEELLRNIRSCELLKEDANPVLDSIDSFF